MKEPKVLVRKARTTPEWLVFLTVNEEGRNLLVALVRPNRTTREFARLTYS